MRQGIIRQTIAQRMETSLQEARDHLLLARRSEGREMVERSRDAIRAVGQTAYCAHEYMRRMPYADKIRVHKILDEIAHIGITAEDLQRKNGINVKMW